MDTQRRIVFDIYQYKYGNQEMDGFTLPEDYFRFIVEAGDDGEVVICPLTAVPVTQAISIPPCPPQGRSLHILIKSSVFAELVYDTGTMSAERWEKFQ